MTWVIDPYAFSIEISGIGMTQPSLLNRVEWTMLALISDTVEVVKLPFAPSEERVELAPGLEIRVEEVSIEDERYAYQSTVILDLDEVAYPDRGTLHPRLYEGLRGHSWPAEGRPETIVLEIDVFDANGVSLQQHGHSVRHSSDGRSIDYHEEGCMIMTQTLRGSGPGCREIAFIGYVIVSEFHLEGLNMAMENLPVPPLCP